LLFFVVALQAEFAFNATFFFFVRFHSRGSSNLVGMRFRKYQTEFSVSSNLLGNVFCLS